MTIVINSDINIAGLKKIEMLIAIIFFMLVKLL